MSENRYAGRNYWKRLKYALFGISIVFLLRPLWIGLIGLLTVHYTNQQIPNSFINITESHSARVIREYEPIGVEFE